MARIGLLFLGWRLIPLGGRQGDLALSRRRKPRRGRWSGLAERQLLR